MQKNWYSDKKFYMWVLIWLVLGTLSGIFAIGAREYYAELTLPWFAPPGWVFGPVWTALYVLLGATFYFILKSKNKILLYLFLVQMFLNFIWSALFFMVKNNALSLVDILIMDILSVIILVMLFKSKSKGRFIFIPYLIWICFATLLTYNVLILN